MSKIQKLPSRRAKKNRTVIAIALFVLAFLLVVGGVMMYQATVGPVQQAVIDAARTQRAEAGQTAVREGQLTREAQ